MSGYVFLVLLGVVAYVQNMAFTWVSRSRNSGDPSYHRWAALCSNGVWFICQILIWRTVWDAINNGTWYFLVAAFFIYVLATTEGSVLMMKILLRTEEGKRRVGAR